MDPNCCCCGCCCWKGLNPVGCANTGILALRNAGDRSIIDGNPDPEETERDDPKEPGDAMDVGENEGGGDVLMDGVNDVGCACNGAEVSDVA